MDASAFTQHVQSICSQLGVLRQEVTTDGASTAAWATEALTQLDAVAVELHELADVLRHRAQLSPRNDIRPGRRARLGRTSFTRPTRKARYRSVPELGDRVRAGTQEREYTAAQVYENQRFIQQVADMTAVLIYVYDLVEQRTIYVNRRATAILGYTVEELEALGPALMPTIVYPDDMVLLMTHLDQFAATVDDEVYKIEYRLLHKNGEWRWIAGRDTVFLRDSDGKTRQIIGTAVDVTERKRVEEELGKVRAELEQRVAERTAALVDANIILRWEIDDRIDAEMRLRESEERLRLVIDAANDAIWDWNLETDAMFWSDRVFQFLGVDAELRTPTYALLREHLHPADRPVFDHAVREHLSHMAPYELELRLRQGDGSYGWFVCKGKAVRDAEGHPQRMVGSLSDITRRKQMEEALRESEERFRHLFEYAPIGIAFALPNYRLFKANVAFCAMLGYSMDEILTLTAKDFTHPDDFRLEVDQIERVKGGEIGHYGIEKRYIKKDGTIIWVYLTSAAVRDKDGQVAYGFAMAEDITDRKQSRERLQASLREKEVLLKEVHHRVKNNLQVISSLLDLQTEQMADPLVATLLRESQNRVRTMAMIHEKLYQSDNLARIDLGRYLEELTAYLFRSYIVHATTVELKTAVDDISLSVDMAIPCGLLVNELLSNAFKYAFPDGRSGTIQIRFEAAASDTYRLIVADNGVGLPQDLDPQRSTTLGLRLVGMLVRQLKGVLELERNGGTVFTITFAVPGPKGAG